MNTPNSVRTASEDTLSRRFDDRSALEPRLNDDARPTDGTIIRNAADIVVRFFSDNPVAISTARTLVAAGGTDECRLASDPPLGSIRRSLPNTHEIHCLILDEAPI